MKKYLPHIIIGIVAILAIVAIVLSGKSILPVFFGTDTDEASTLLDTDESMVGKKMPTFNLPKASGGLMNSAELMNGPAVIVFWTTWNRESADTLKIIDDYFALTSRERNLVKIVAVDSQEDSSIVKAFVRRGGYGADVLLDVSGLVTSDFRVTSLPTFFFVSSEGVVTEIHRGALSTVGLVEKIEKLLSGSGV
jgi:hypothetical protein